MNSNDTPLRTLSRSQLAPSPFDQFNTWFDEAAAVCPEPNAMALATSSGQGKPSCRMVLMKHFDRHGFVFFTNYNSRKAKEITTQNYAAATFYWRELDRQVILEGGVERTSLEESKRYFDMRPRGSKIAALASQQDQVLPSRSELEEEYRRLEKLYPNENIPLPEYWGGFRIRPQRFEFWQSRTHRLHDRFSYNLENGTWRVDRLAP